MAYKPRIKLIVTTANGVATSEIKAPNVTDAMYDAAWDLIYTMSTNRRRKPAPRYKMYREKNEREAAAHKAKKLARKPSKRKKAVLAAVAQMGADAITKELGRPSKASRLAKPVRGNADGTGIHSMVEGNRDDHQT